jgi:hypothetical protein
LIDVSRGRHFPGGLRARGALVLLAVAVAFLGWLVPFGAASASAGPGDGANQRSSATAATLTIDVTDLPAKAAGSLRVTGPRGYRRSVTKTTRLSGLVSGTYAITANPVVVKRTTYVPTVTGAARHLAAGGKATSTAAYATAVPVTTVGLAGSAVRSIAAKGGTETITLTAPAAVKAGDVIVVDAGSRTPDGLLARVTAVKGRVLTAAPASIQQALPRGEFSTTVTVSGAAAGGASRTREAAATAARPTADTSFKCGAGGTVTATVTRELTPELAVAAQWGVAGGTQIIADLSVAGTIGVSASVSAGAKCDLDIALNPVDLAARRFKIAKLLKLVISPKLVPYIKAAIQSNSAESLSAAIKINGSVQITYGHGGVTVADGLTATSSYTAPHADGTGSVELTPGIRAGIDVSLAGSVSANIDAGPRLDTAKDGIPAWALDGVVRAGLAADLLGLKKSDDALVVKSFPITHPETDAPGALSSLACPSAAVCEASYESEGLTGNRPFGSTDGGELWVPQTVPDGVDSTSGISCPTVRRCYAAAVVGATAESNGVAAIIDTSNGGASWTLTYKGGTGSSLSSIACPSISHCVATGYNTIAVTANGGTHWTTVTPPGTSQPASVSCPSASLCFATAADVDTDSTSVGAILRSANGGLTWTETKLGFQGALNAISCPSARECIATGQGTGVNGVVARTVDGSDWTHLVLPANNAIFIGNVSCPTAKVCFAVGRGTQGEIAGGGVLRSADAGLTWKNESIPGGEAGFPTAIACRSASDCELVGNIQQEIFMPDISAASTTDAGAKWQIQLP